MTIKDFSALQRSRAELMRDPALRERLGVVAANKVSALVKRRVFQDGIAQNGGQIGAYSRKPGWFTIDTPGLPRIAPRGKPPSKRAKKTFYSETGYSGFRAAVGRQNAKVDLNLTGATFNGVGTGTSPQNGQPAFGIRTQEALTRIEGNEDRFNAVTVTPNPEERNEGRDAARRELKFILKLD